MGESRMFTYDSARWTLLVVALTVSLSGMAEEVAPDLGLPMTAAEINKVSITVFPDGHNLPNGQGSAREGESLYLER